MKIIKISLLLISVLLCLAGCSGQTTKIEKTDSSSNGIIAVEKTDDETKTEEKQETEKKNSFDSETVASQLSITEYSRFDTFSNYHFIEVTNNSEVNTGVDLNILYYNSSGDLISAESCSEEIIEPGYSVLLYTMPDEKWDKTEITIEAVEPKWYDPIQSDIEITATPAKEKIVIQAKNIGEEPAEFVVVKALAFNGEDVVGFNWTYFTDNDSQLKPGKTISENLDFYNDFDGYKYYVSGRRNK